MATIYDLSKEQEMLLNELFWNYEEDDEQTALIEARLNEIKLSAKAKIDFVSDILLESEAIAEKKREAVKSMEAQIKRLDKNSKRLREYIITALEVTGEKSIDCSHCHITKALGPEKIVYPEGFTVDMLPADMKIVEEVVKPKTFEIKRWASVYPLNYLGISLTRTPYLRIK